MASRVNYLAVIQSRNGSYFRACDVSKQLNINAGTVRVWLCRDVKAGLVKKGEAGCYAVVSSEAITAEIEKIKRNSATGGSSRDVKSHSPAAPQLCRLHNVEFKMTLQGENMGTLAPKLAEWDGVNSGSGVRRWKTEVILPDTAMRVSVMVSAGSNKARLQAWVNPIITNSYKVLDQLDAVHDAAQWFATWLSRYHKITAGLLEVQKAAHFAIRIPIKEGDKLQKLYGMRKGKVWIDEHWWIDASDGDELETQSEAAFHDLMHGLQRVGTVEKKLDMIFNILTKQREPDFSQHPPPSGTGEEVA